MGRDQTPVKRERLLTESLKDQGFHTGLFANVTIFFVRGLSQGALTKNYKTSRYTVHGAKPGAKHLTDGLIKHIDMWRAKKLRPQRRRLFVWGHYYDPHDPYFDVPNYPARSAQAHHRYEAIVRSVDAELGRLFQALETRGMLKETAVVLTADHGDEFGEHGHRFHGRTLYDEMVRVPLIVYSPAYPPQKVKEVISHLDVAPTLLSHLGLKPEPRFLGQDWDSALRRGKSVAQSEAFFEVLPDANYGLHLIGMRRGDEKLIYHVQSGALERFGLKTDPYELMNLTVRSSQKINQSSQNTQRLMGYVEAHLRQLARRESGARFPR
jgi:arylsulfatase A-like enzyme